MEPVKVPNQNERKRLPYPHICCQKYKQRVLNGQNYRGFLLSVVNVSGFDDDVPIPGQAKLASSKVLRANSGRNISQTRPSYFPMCQK